MLYKCGDSGGGTYSVGEVNKLTVQILTASLLSEDYRQLDEMLCQSAIECIVREKLVYILFFIFINSV